MKYTSEQKKKLNKKQMVRFEKHHKPTLPNVQIVGEYFIVESKINYEKL